MPRSMLRRGESISAGIPSTRISPSSGTCMPASRLTNVDLPAPFSPSNTWISPGWNSRDTRSRATTPGKRFVTPRRAATAPRPDLAGSAGCPRRVASSIIRVVARAPRTCRNKGRRLLRRRRHRGHQRANFDGIEDRLDLQRAVDDLLAHRLDLGPGLVGNMLRVQQAHGVVRELEAVGVSAELVYLEILDHRRIHGHEVPDHRREKVSLVDRRFVADHVDEPDLAAVGRLLGFHRRNMPKLAP